MPLRPIERLPEEVEFHLELALSQWRLKFRPARLDPSGIARWAVHWNFRGYGSWPDPKFALAVRNVEVVLQTLGEVGLDPIPAREIHRMLESMRPEQIVLRAVEDKAIQEIMKGMGL